MIRVVDAKSRPVIGATVRAETARHAFPFGTAVVVGGLFVQGAGGDRYRATIKNHLKRPMWEEQSNRRVSLAKCSETVTIRT